MVFFHEKIENSPNVEILNAWLKTSDKLKNCDSALCSVSGGADSDIVVDMLATLDDEHKVTYVFFDTGLEYQATKQHIKELEEKYNIEIITRKAVKPIPLCCREYGVPFLSKQVSEWISRLQKHNFKWEDKSYEELCKEYPKCLAALRWWCNQYGEKSKFNIQYNTYLKEFMIANPPTFKISNKCCHYAKKLVAKRFQEEGDFDLNITGVRKAEGGARSSAYKTCFTPGRDKGGLDELRPIFWFRQEEKEAYKDFYEIQHSDCYEVWGLPRTGCSGCPYARDFESELEAVEKYEPKLYKALNKVFGQSYDYTRQYREFQKKMKDRG